MAITLNGTTGVTTTGLTSNGIDDNATSTAMTLDTSGNLLVGTTSSDDSTDGFKVKSNGQKLTVTRDGAEPLVLNRRTSDGDIVKFRKDNTTVGSIGVINSNNLTINGTASNHTGLQFGTSIIWPMLNSANADGTVDLGTTTGRFKDLYLSGGVYLGGTGSANKLDDYEEGTFTPNLGGSGSNPTATYSQQYGHYTKVGRMVYISLRVRASAYSGGSGVLQIYGLPFTPNTGTQHNIGGTFVSGPYWGASKTQFAPWVLDNGQAKVQFRGYENNSGNYDLTVSDYSANDYIDVNGWYFV